MELHKIYYRHYRFYKGWTRKETVTSFLERYVRSGRSKSRWTPLPKGGKTEAVAVITYGDQTYEIVASTACRPDEAFEYSEGRKHSLRRLNRLLDHMTAMENLAESKL